MAAAERGSTWLTLFAAFFPSFQPACPTSVGLQWTFHDGIQDAVAIQLPVELGAGTGVLAANERRCSCEPLFARHPVVRRGDVSDLLQGNQLFELLRRAINHLTTGQDILLICKYRSDRQLGRGFSTNAISALYTKTIIISRMRKC